ncbi:phytoene desaturase [Novosphingobium kunmingense]|uniref:Phytoene desaturase n=1 Tax=Novosphingobium kunmingense TaxID=1211806 RepID=A0A2N0HJQ1_9SPHN|nr:phytoene desaturase family protein [Novosphingobium kunmingense]PKB19157.1 phytoene desaturase [Novosphingobium kunmingense]
MPAAPSLPGSRHVAVIGAGLGGLATALRLRAAGIAVTVIEARPTVGGHSHALTRDGFTFCAGPTTTTDRPGLEELWALTGTAVERDVPLFAVNPHCRFSWPDGTSFDLAADDAAAAQDVARFAPGDLAGFQDYSRIAAAQFTEFRGRPGPTPFADLREMAGHAPQLARAQAWRSLWSLIGAHVKDERLREALAVPALMDGADPFTASALLASGFARARQGGLWWPMGGPAALCTALAKRFEAMGGTVRLHDPVCRVHTLGNRAHEIETQSGWRQRFDAVVSTADRDHTWRDLLAGTLRADTMSARLRSRPHAFGLFTVHFALEGTWPGIPHQMALMGPRFRALIEDITIHGVLPQDQLIWLSHPSLADPTLAPPGKSVFHAQVPVANLGKLPIDWETVGPLLEQRVLDEVGRRLVPDIRDRLITSFHTTPRDAMLDFNAAKGTAFGLAPLPLWHAGSTHPRRDKSIGNLYFAGAAAAPGGGMPAALASSRACAALIVEALT